MYLLKGTTYHARGSSICRAYKYLHSFLPRKITQCRTPPKMVVCYRTTPPPWLLLAISQPKWITGGNVLTMDEVLRFYAPRDFHNMAEMGVNAVRIPMPCRAFHDDVSSTGTSVHGLEAVGQGRGCGVEGDFGPRGGDGGGRSGAGIVNGGMQGGPPTRLQ
jgi:hypothetical protein